MFSTIGNGLRTVLSHQVFKNIKDSTIINEAQLENAFNKIKGNNANDNVSEALVKVAELIEKSQDPSAAVLFNEFNGI